LTLDNDNYVEGGHSLNFDLVSGQTTGYVVNSDMTQVDLSDEDEIGTLFAWVYIPDYSIITSFALDWGSSASAYWSRTVTTPHDNTSFHNGWNLLAFNWNGATETGTVDPATIDYLKLTVVWDGTAETDLRLDRIWCSSGETYEVVYYSDHLFKNTGGTWLDIPTDDSDTINIDIDGYAIYLLEVTKLCLQQVKGVHAEADINNADLELYGSGNRIGLYEKYTEAHPSEVMRAVGIFYDTELYN